MSRRVLLFSDEGRRMAERGPVFREHPMYSDERPGCQECQGHPRGECPYCGYDGRVARDCAPCEDTGLIAERDGTYSLCRNCTPGDDRGIA